ncbi:MAG TPA: DUF6707 family protein [Gemmata sp.]
MAKMGWPVPAVFDLTNEPVKVIAQAKAKLKKFRWSHAQSLYDAGALAVLFHVFERDDEALEVCRALGQIQFDGKFSLWGGVETALTLQARVLRRRDETAEADECVRRVREAGYSDNRLEGSLLDRNDTVSLAVQGGNKRSELAGRITMAKEIAFIIELGGSGKCPIDRMEWEWGSNMTRLRELTGAGS